MNMPVRYVHNSTFTSVDLEKMCFALAASLRVRCYTSGSMCLLEL